MEWTELIINISLINFDETKSCFREKLLLEKKHTSSICIYFCKFIYSIDIMSFVYVVLPKMSIGYSQNVL
jgi:hypothetical protein